MKNARISCRDSLLDQDKQGGNLVQLPGEKSGPDWLAEFQRALGAGMQSEMLRGKNVADLGCGDGAQSLRMHQFGANVHGVDHKFRHEWQDPCATAAGLNSIQAMRLNEKEVRERSSNNGLTFEVADVRTWLEGQVSAGIHHDGFYLRRLLQWVSPTDLQSIVQNICKSADRGSWVYISAWDRDPYRRPHAPYYIHPVTDVVGLFLDYTSSVEKIKLEHCSAETLKHGWSNPRSMVPETVEFHWYELLLRFV